MGTIQKWLMHAQPMHEQSPHRRQATVQTIMQVCEFAWHANCNEMVENKKKSKLIVRNLILLDSFFV